MFRIALAFCAGAAALHALPALWPPAAAMAIAAAAAVLLRRAPALAAGLAGFAWALWIAWLAVESGWPCNRDREQVALDGIVRAPAQVRPGRTDFDLELERDGRSARWPLRVRLSWYEPTDTPRAGERWRSGARLRCRRGFVNPGAPDRELALLRDRIGATGYVAGEPLPRRLAVAPAHPVERLRERVSDAISRSLPAGASAAVLQGLSVGLRGNIPDRLWDALGVTGVAHLVAISGLHVTGCALIVLFLLRLAWRMRALRAVRRRVAVEGATIVAVTAAYALLSGASVPALRTLAMVCAFAALRILRRSLPLHRLLALAALALVAADPLAVASAGFWLSFVATAALLAAGTGGAGAQGRIAAFTRAQLSIAALLTPVLVAAFGRLSVVAPLVNAVAIPAFTFLLLPAVLLGTAIALLAPGASAAMWQALAWLLDRAWPALEWIAGWPAASWAPAAQPAVLVAAAGAVVLAVLLLPLAGLRSAAAVLLFAVVGGGAVRPAAGAFTLSVVDVGQGLAAVVETAEHALVFDTGPRWRGGGEAARVSLLPYLRSRGIRRIDRLVLSHGDADHAGGAALIRRELEVGSTLSLPGSGGAGDASCIRGRHWQWDGVAFRVLHPRADYHGSDNDRSCALHVAGPGGAALLLADSEAAAEAALAAGAIAANVVLVPHHGSAGSSSPALVAAVAARIAIASAGFGNRWDMPRAEAVARWRASGTTVLDTARAGAIRVSVPTGGGPLAVESERRDRPRWWRAGAGG
jgi:competence protein ComEC